MAIIGREKEIEEFRHLYDSGKAEFVAIYGRRRVGKTFLVDETLKGKATHEERLDCGEHIYDEGVCLTLCS